MDPVTVFLRKLLERINSQIAERSAHLIAGTSVKDIETYRERVGYIHGLRDAAQWADEVLKEGPGSQDDNRAVRPLPYHKSSRAV